MDEYLPFRIDLNDLFLLEDEPVTGVVTMTCQIGTAEARQALLAKYSFIHSILPQESPTYPDNFYFVTDWGNVSFSANGSRLVVHDYERDTAIGMLYNTSDPYFQTSPEYRDFQRTVNISGRDGQGKKFSRELTCEADGGILDYSGMAVQAFSSDHFPRRGIYETASLIDFLRQAKSTPVIEKFLKNVAEQNDRLQEEAGGVEPEPSAGFFSLGNIQSVEQLMDIFRLLPANPQNYALLLGCCLRYHAYDQATKDEYRDPVTTLRSTWADCDDFAVINYFWAYLHGNEPHMTVISAGGADHHVLVWYRNSQQELVVMDNNDVLVLDPHYDIRGYLDEFSSAYAGRGYSIEYDGPA